MPRIRHFTSKLLRTLIQMTTVPGSNPKQYEVLQPKAVVITERKGKEPAVTKILVENAKQYIKERMQYMVRSASDRTKAFYNDFSAKNNLAMMAMNSDMKNDVQAFEANERNIQLHEIKKLLEYVHSLGLGPDIEGLYETIRAVTAVAGGTFAPVMKTSAPDSMEGTSSSVHQSPSMKVNGVGTTTDIVSPGVVWSLARGVIAGMPVLAIEDLDSARTPVHTLASPRMPRAMSMGSFGQCVVEGRFLHSGSGGSYQLTPRLLEIVDTVTGSRKRKISLAESSGGVSERIVYQPGRNPVHTLASTRMTTAMSQGSFGQCVVEGRFIHSGSGDSYKLTPSLEHNLEDTGTEASKRKINLVESSDGGSDRIVYQPKHTANVPVELNLLANFVDGGVKKLDDPAAICSGVSPFTERKAYPFLIAQDAEKGFTNMNNCSNDVLQRTWVDHTGQTRVTMNGHAVYKQIVDLGYMTYTSIELVNRALLQKEAKWYPEGHRARFRHPLHPYFAACVMRGGDDYLHDKHIRDMFLGNHLGYDVETCTLIMAEVLGEGDSCVLYVFDVKEKVVRVLDPKRNCEEFAYLSNKHLGVMKRLLHGLCRCINEFFEGWTLNEEEFSFVAHRLMHENAARSDTAIYMIHYMMHFDGDSVTRGIWKGTDDKLRHQIPQMILNIEGNRGAVPVAVTSPWG